MTKKFFNIFIISILFISLSFPKKAHANMDPKVKAFVTIAAYGTAGGALLGFASMAFGTSARNIARGASLGLYAGILFGTFVIVSHAYNPAMETPYEGSGSPYENAPSSYQNDNLWEKPLKLNNYNLVKNTNESIPPVSFDFFKVEF